MKFGIIFANTGPFVEPAAAARFAKAAEAAGFESIWTVEHVVVPSGYTSTYPYDPSGKMPGAEHGQPLAEPDLGVEGLHEHGLSGGRVDLGIGVGWLEEEFDAIGVPFADRGRRTDEYVAAMRALWSGRPTDFSGDFVNFQACISRPAPAAPVPIHIGGHSIAAARRAGRLGDGFFPGRGSHAESTTRRR